MADATPRSTSSLPNVVEWRMFLTDYPPGTRASVEGAVQEVGNNGRPKFTLPELQLHCDGTCQGPSYCVGVTQAVGSLFPGPDIRQCYDGILRYQCHKCNTSVKSYAVRILRDGPTLTPLRTADVAKLGEWPAFCPRMPSKVNSLIGPDRDLFFKGRMAESSGFGVGAFAYYRRIVEDQKNRLLDEVINVARRAESPVDAIAKLEAAREEIQFAKAVDLAKDAVPASLLIKGHNPLTILHRALSRDLHGTSDEECLREAHAIRVVLFEFADKLATALRDQRELDEAVSHLLNA